MPGLGFGGGTLARDVQALREAGKRAGAGTFVLDAIMNANERRKGYVARRLEKALLGLEDRRVSFLGIAYKAGTSTLRRSLVLDMAQELAKKGAEVRAYDPFVKGRIAGFPKLGICKDAKELFDGADAVVLATHGGDFAGLDFASLCGLMRTPVILDCVGALSKAQLGKGTKYYAVGISHGKK
jgi:UDPglucose 6-dehydrogenase